MLAKKTLERYAEQIPDEKLRERFRKLIKEIHWQGKLGFETCTETNVQEVAKKMNLEESMQDFHKRTFEFVPTVRIRKISIPPKS